MAHRVRRAALPRPSDDQTVYGLITDVVERDELDQDRPLWECLDAVEGDARRPRSGAADEDSLLDRRWNRRRTMLAQLCDD